MMVNKDVIKLNEYENMFILISYKA